MEIKLSDKLKEAAFNMAFGKGYDAAVEVLDMLLEPGMMNETDRKYLMKCMGICKRIIIKGEKVC